MTTTVTEFLSTVVKTCGVVVVLNACSAGGASGPPKADDGAGRRPGVVSEGITADVNLGPIESVAHIVQRSTTNSALLDAPADNAFTAVKAAFAANSHHDIRLAVYDVAPVASPATLAKSRGLSLGIDTDKTPLKNLPEGAVSLAKGAWELTVEATSGGESYVDTSRHHKGTETTTLLSDDEYMGKAAAYIASAFPALPNRLASYPMRLRHYHNANVNYAVGGDPSTRGTPTEGIYELAVVHNTAIDGLPVIGPGGKYKVWMSPAGDVLGHMHSIRKLAGIHATVSGDQLVDPATAQASLESKLAGRGVNMSQYQLAKAQFGYLQRDNGSLQQIVAPHYLFMYTATVPGQKNIIETIPAVSDPKVLADIAADEAANATTIPSPTPNSRVQSVPRVR